MCIIWNVAKGTISQGIAFSATITPLAPFVIMTVFCSHGGVSRDVFWPPVEVDSVESDQSLLPPTPSCGPGFPGGEVSVTPIMGLGRSVDGPGAGVSANDSSGEGGCAGG
jgi:hypothetical protein